MTQHREGIMASNQRLLRIAMAECRVCGRMTRNPQFCSRSCAAKLNNVLVPKRQRGGRCAVCGEPIALRAKYCAAHKPNKPLDRSQPISAVYKTAGHLIYRRTRLREDARKQYLSALDRKSVV